MRIKLKTLKQELKFQVLLLPPLVLVLVLLALVVCTQRGCPV